MTEPTGELNADFSQPGATATPWPEVAGALTEAEIFWLSTVRGDGRPHVTPIPAIWDREALHFCTGTEEQKTKNLGHDPRCALTTGTNRLRSGLDVVVEGTAERVLDHARLVDLAGLWLSKLDWRFEVGEDSFSDGTHSAWVYAVRPTKVLAFRKGGEFSQTRFRF